MPPSPPWRARGRSRKYQRQRQNAEIGGYSPDMSEAAKFVIRNARADDAPSLGRLGALLVALHHDFDPDRFIAPGPGTERGYGSFLVSQIERPEVILLVAEGDGAVLG